MSLHFSQRCHYNRFSSLPFEMSYTSYTISCRQWECQLSHIAFKARVSIRYGPTYRWRSGFTPRTTCPRIQGNKAKVLYVQNLSIATDCLPMDRLTNPIPSSVNHLFKGGVEHDHERFKGRPMTQAGSHFLCLGRRLHSELRVMNYRVVSGPRPLRQNRLSGWL